MKIKVLNEGWRQITEIPHYEDLKKNAYIYSEGRKCLFTVSFTKDVEGVNFCVRKNPEQLKWTNIGSLEIREMPSAREVRFTIVVIQGRNAYFLESFSTRKQAILQFNDYVDQLRKAIDLDSIGDDVPKFKKIVKNALLKISKEI